MNQNQLIYHPIIVKPFTQEIDGATKDLYYGIYNIILNFKISIALIPEWGGNGVLEKIELPENFDLITTSDQAKEIVSILSDIVITSNSSLNGEIKVITKNQLVSDNVTIVFYVSKMELLIFVKEVQALLQTDFYNLKGFVTLNQILNYDISKFIIEKIFPVITNHFDISNK